MAESTPAQKPPAALAPRPEVRRESPPKQAHDLWIWVIAALAVVALGVRRPQGTGAP